MTLLDSMGLKLDLYVHKAMEDHVLQFEKLIPKHHRYMKRNSVASTRKFQSQKCIGVQRVKGILVTLYTTVLMCMYMYL